MDRNSPLKHNQTELFACCMSSYSRIQLNLQVLVKVSLIFLSYIALETSRLARASSSVKLEANGIISKLPSTSYSPAQCLLDQQNLNVGEEKLKPWPGLSVLGPLFSHLIICISPNKCVSFSLPAHSPCIDCFLGLGHSPSPLWSATS